MGKQIDITGQRFGNLVALRRCKELFDGRRFKWVCQCDCGAIREFLPTPLKNGHTRSCGCKNTFLGKHKKTNTRLYKIWTKIKERCYNVNSGVYKYYGLLGIKMCDEWVGDFMAFYSWAIKNGYNDNLSLDRYPNQKGNYEPTNCRWATDVEQNRNSAHNILITIGDETMCISEFAEKYNLNYDTFYTRVMSKTYPRSMLLKRPNKVQ